MFGEYGLYYRGKNFALVCDNTLFVKITEAGAAKAGRVSQARPTTCQTGLSNLFGETERPRLDHLVGDSDERCFAAAQEKGFRVRP